MVLFILMMGGLSACSTIALNNGTKSTSAKYFSRSESGLLAYARHLGELGPGQLGKEQSAATAEYRNQDDNYNTLRLALALMQSTTDMAKQNSAEALLRKLMRNRSTAGVNSFVYQNEAYYDLGQLLLNTIAARKQLVADHHELEQKLEKLLFIENRFGNTNGANQR
ncbi:hypothetical protein [uncultured Zhongshania sp.]|uniref:hypothetical protein n=1 Tax=uncultured Zhongshania sp. TaxID=1642288 RepID=UPI0025F83CB9|nr:hypothetical protein [uncultured Zhongshania sp.]